MRMAPTLVAGITTLVPELGDPKLVQDQATAKANATLSADESVKLD